MVFFGGGEGSRRIRRWRGGRGRAAFFLLIPSKANDYQAGEKKESRTIRTYVHNMINIVDIQIWLLHFLQHIQV